MKHRNNRTHTKKIDVKFFGTIALAAAAPFMIAAYGWEAATTSETVTSGLLSLDTNINKKILTQTAGYTNTIKDSTSVLNEAIKTTISQEALAATQIATSDKRAKQMEVATLAAKRISDDIIDAKLNYGARTGQGYNVCQVFSENKQLDAAFNAAPIMVDRKVNQLDNGPGKLVKSQQEAREARDAVHERFCSAEEKAANKCEKVSKIAGADSNANVLFVSSAPDSDLQKAKAAVRQNILGSPDLAIPAAAGGTVTGQAYLANINRKTALSAFPAYSLAYLDSMSEVRDDLKDKDGKLQSPNDVLFKTVTRYYGGPEALEWQKSMIEQQPRGMLVELAKMEGLGAWMDYQEYLANQRLEGNLAAMNLITALPMEDALSRQRKHMAKVTVNSMAAK